MTPIVTVFGDLDMPAFCLRLRTVREAKRLSQTTLACFADMSVSYYNDIERGRTPGLTANTLYKLCQVLGVSADALLGLSPGLPTS